MRKVYKTGRVWDIDLGELKALVQKSNTFTEILRSMGYKGGLSKAKASLTERLDQEEVDYKHLFYPTIKVRNKIDTLSDEAFTDLVKSSYGYSDICLSVGYTANVGAWGNTIKSRLDQLNLSREDFKQRDKHYQSPSLNEVLCKGTTLTVKHKKQLKDKLGLICSQCFVTDVWRGEPLSLELDHIDGDNRNNELSNLRVLCPNCHSQTKTFRSRNRDSMETYCTCGNKMSSKGNECLACSLKRRSKGIDKDKILSYSREATTIGNLAELLGCSHKTVRSYNKKYEITDHVKQNLKDNRRNKEF